MASDITLRVSADTSQAINSLNNLTVKLKQVGNDFDFASTKIGKISTTISLVGTATNTLTAYMQKFISVATELVNSYAAQEQAEVRLQATLKATQNACGMTASEMIFAMWENIFY